MITCPQCRIISHNPNDERARYCGNCHQFHDEMNHAWLTKVLDHLRTTPDGLTAEQLAERIHEALEIAEVRKYATENSRFAFVFDGASEDDLVRMRAILTPFENLIVDLKRK